MKWVKVKVFHLNSYYGTDEEKKISVWIDIIPNTEFKYKLCIDGEYHGDWKYLKAAKEFAEKEKNERTC